MSWLSGSQQQQGPDPVQAAKVEMEMYTGKLSISSIEFSLVVMFLFLSLRLDRLLDLFNKIASSCFAKCASRRHREPDITLGEMTCTVSRNSRFLPPEYDFSQSICCRFVDRIDAYRST